MTTLLHFTLWQCILILALVLIAGMIIGHVLGWFAAVRRMKRARDKGQSLPSLLDEIEGREGGEHVG